MRLWIARAGSAAPSTWLLLCGLLLLGADPVRASDAREVSAGVGEVEVLVDGPGKAMELEVRFPPRRFTFLPRSVPKLAPIVGTFTTSRGTLYAYAGLRLDLPLGKDGRSRWHFSPSLSGGLYYRGEGQNLGGPFEFRSVLELSYALDDRTRLGVCIDHLSNGGIFKLNPGSESLIVRVSKVLGRAR